EGAPVAPAGRKAGPGEEEPASPAGDGGEPDPRSVLGVDPQTEAVRRAKKAPFFPGEKDARRPMGRSADDRARAAPPAGADPGPSDMSLMPDVFEFRRVPGPRGALGYIRLYTFMVDDADAFVHEFARIARLLPQTGLIVDVRGNGGGNIL